MTEILRTRAEIHLSRKLFHVLSGTAIMLLFVNTFTRMESIVLMAMGAAIFVVLDLMRLSIPAMNRIALKVWGPLMREGEHTGPSAQLYYLFGLTWAVCVLPKPIAVQAILTLAWMDPMAAIFGIRFGRLRWNSVLHTSVSLGAKTIEGSCAGFLAGFLAGVIAWTGPWAAVSMNGGLWWPSPLRILILSSAGALVGLIAEAWPTQWDDNVNIPFWSGLAVWVVALLTGTPLRFL
ncbi:MAG: hypothetical protein JST16_04280 [Bdellovibrionales bacterium]|nr:hypothetical protein [Bdellovibrionales bacterium]